MSMVVYARHERQMKRRDEKDKTFHEPQHEHVPKPKHMHIAVAHPAHQLCHSIRSMWLNTHGKVIYDMVNSIYPTHLRILHCF